MTFHTHSRIDNTMTDARQVLQQGTSTQRVSYKELYATCRDFSLQFRDCSSERLSPVAESATCLLKIPVYENPVSRTWTVRILGDRMSSARRT